MGLFTKNKKEDGYTNKLPKLPTLPELPGHAEFPEIPAANEPSPGELLNLKNNEPEIHQLPSFPTSPNAEKFSQNTIKDAVGLPEENYEYEDEIEDEIEDEKLPKMIPEKVNAPIIESTPYIDKSPTSIKDKIEKEKEVPQRVKSTEPIFIRIDKFENSLKIFQTAKRKISEIEELLKNTKELKAKEQEELTAWEEEILQLKMQIEKVDEDIFSKVE